VNRRDFLLLRVDPGTSAVTLSCERLYMRYVDASSDGTTRALFERLADDLRQVKEVRLVETAWLSDEGLRRELDAVLDAFRGHGGRVLNS
jgi:hypothetical protein